MYEKSLCVYLSGAQADDEVSDERVLGLARSVADHDTPAVGLRQLARVDRLGHTADLVDLEEQAIAGLLLNGRLNALRVGHGQVVADQLDRCVGLELGPRGPVVLLERVLDRGDRVLGDHLLVDRSQLIRSDLFRKIKLQLL